MQKIIPAKNICYFGDILVETRKRLGISQYRLAQLSGISDRYLNFLEHGRVEPRIGMVIRLATALGVPPGDMINATATRIAEVQTTDTLTE